MLSMEKLQQIEKEVLEQIKNVIDLKTIEEIRVRYLGKKGILTELLKKIADLSLEEKKTFGKEIHTLKEKITFSLDQAKETLLTREKNKKLEQEALDITLPGKVFQNGAYHPISLVIQDIVRIFTRMGFVMKEGPELEDEYYNFDALNIPSDHPARDDQDSFYVAPQKLLRTQTSAVQIRAMEKMNPPLAIISAGKCYRKDAIDATHFPMFHQVEGLVVDKDIAFSDLKGVLALFAKEMFGAKTKVRFRPDFFPFTEPSAEFGCTCFVCGGKGCPTCKRTGWIEIGGCGMVDPEVFRFVNIDYEVYKGYAFGLGIERIAMFKYDIPDIRYFYENDIRFLNQFK